MNNLSRVFAPNVNRMSKFSKRKKKHIRTTFVLVDEKINKSLCEIRQMEISKWSIVETVAQSRSNDDIAALRSEWHRSIRYQRNFNIKFKSEWSVDRWKCGRNREFWERWLEECSSIFLNSNTKKTKIAMDISFFVLLFDSAVVIADDQMLSSTSSSTRRTERERERTDWI